MFWELFGILCSHVFSLGGTLSNVKIQEATKHDSNLAKNVKLNGWCLLKKNKLNLEECLMAAGQEIAEMLQAEMRLMQKDTNHTFYWLQQ